MLIDNSTITGNDAGHFSGLFFGAVGKISNSTIAGNTSHVSPQGTGIFILAGTLELESTLIAANTADAGAGREPDDVGANGSSELTGANNLIFSTSTTVPADTLVGIDPLLLPLADNGGADDYPGPVRE